MKNTRLLNELKEVTYDIVDNNGNFRTIPIGMVGKRNISDDRLHLLQSFVTLLKSTNIICNETKLYVFNRYITIRGVNEELNAVKKEKEIPYNTTLSKITYDRMKLERTFGLTIISDILYKENNSETLKAHVKKITESYTKYGDNKNDLRDNIALELDRGSLCVELDEARFEQFKEVIKPYIKSHMQTIANELIDKDSIGYFNYLLYSPVLSDIDKHRLEDIKRLLDTHQDIIEAV